ncbi:hypothetical protein DL89DRAFT_26502 [Linderina pennispora]|uniref:Zn(2)-C6 fungal-type domain-containing protein n=1 Tax=Linderina pennispora TaxID=61395 RepID=A0A1Y1W3Q1_9FUNG|nr:uncharacterized protein DL89DRAFT_26502 [Linderina pennispora]ORX68097.1 hypothetical protein DL89DRAFT_26502 [Linderina pennispora]
MDSTQQAQPAQQAQQAQGPLVTIPLLKSCESCRQRKIKCSGDKPTCAHCARRHQPCIYRRSARYKRRLNPGGAAAKDDKSAKKLTEAPQNASSDVPQQQQQQQQQTEAAVATATLASTMEPAPIATGEAATVDDSLPLSALFGTSLINESDILPPSILQSMNFWMNDSLLTASPTVATAPGNNPVQQPPLPPPISAPQYPIASNINTLGPGNMNNSLANLVPMDVALGLPNLATPVSPQAPGIQSNVTPFLQ